MATNKVILNGEVKIDLTKDTVTEHDVRKGKTFHKADGIMVQGTLEEQQVYGTIPRSIDYFETEGYYTIPSEDIDIIIPEGVKHLNRCGLLQNGVGGIFNIYFPTSLESIKCYYDGPFGGASGNYAWFNLYTPNLDLYFHETLTAYAQYQNDYNNGGYLYCPIFKNLQGEVIDEFIIPEGIECIPDSFFPRAVDYRSSGNYRGFTISLPSSIKRIYHSFGDQGEFFPTLIELKTSTPPENSGSISGIVVTPAELTIIIPQGSLEAYSNASTWCDYVEFMIEKDAATNWSINRTSFSFNGNITWEDFVNSTNANQDFAFSDNGYVLYQGKEILQQLTSYPDTPCQVVGSTYIKNVAYYTN